MTDHETLSGNITSSTADHFAQFLLIKKCHVNCKSCSYFVHDYSSYEEEKFIHDFSLLDWSSLDNSDISVNNHFNFFYEKTNTCIEQHVPKKKVTKKNLKLRTKPWISSDIQKLMSYRDKLFAKMVKSPSAVNNMLLLTESAVHMRKYLL